MAHPETDGNRKRSARLAFELLADVDPDQRVSDPDLDADELLDGLCEPTKL